MSITFKILGYDDLTDDEKESASDNGCGKEYANYLKVMENDRVIAFESDAMEPEDASFGRDLGWIPTLLEFIIDSTAKDAERYRMLKEHITPAYLVGEGFKDMGDIFPFESIAERIDDMVDERISREGCTT